MLPSWFAQSLGKFFALFLPLRLQQAPAPCLFISRRHDLFSVLCSAFWDDVALKVSGGGFTCPNTNKIRATMLQVFKSLPKTCKILLQQNVALKIALAMHLHEKDERLPCPKTHFMYTQNGERQRI